MIRYNVTFYRLVNGFAYEFGVGKEISLKNGSVYAVIDGIYYRVIFDGYNNQKLVRVS